DADDPRRDEYLARFADREGSDFLMRFYQKYRGKNAQEAEALLLATLRPTPSRLAAMYRTIEPAGTLPQFSKFINDNLPSPNEVDDARIVKMYATYDPAAMSLADRGYVSSIHPLEL